jgi:hypothetical protein
VVVEVVEEVDDVVDEGADDWPTEIVTVDPEPTTLPAAGFCEQTLPTWQLPVAGTVWIA